MRREVLNDLWIDSTKKGAEVPPQADILDILDIDKVEHHRAPHLLTCEKSLSISRVSGFDVIALKCRVQTYR